MRVLAMCCLAGAAAGLVAGAAATLMAPRAGEVPIHLGIDLGAAHDLLADLDLGEDPFDGAVPGQIRAYIDYVVYQLMQY